MRSDLKVVGRHARVIFLNPINIWSFPDFIALVSKCDQILYTTGNKEVEQGMMSINEW